LGREHHPLRPLASATRMHNHSPNTNKDGGDATRRDFEGVRSFEQFDYVLRDVVNDVRFKKDHAPPSKSDESAPDSMRQKLNTARSCLGRTCLWCTPPVLLVLFVAGALFSEKTAEMASGLRMLYDKHDTKMYGSPDLPPPPSAASPQAPPWVAAPNASFWDRTLGDPANWPLALEMSGNLRTFALLYQSFLLRVIEPNNITHIFVYAYANNNDEGEHHAAKLLRALPQTKALELETFPIKPELREEIIQPHRRAWDELGLSTKRLYLDKRRDKKLPSPAIALLSMWRQRRKAAELRQIYQYEHSMRFRAVLVWRPDISLFRPLHLAELGKVPHALYIPKCCDHGRDGLNDHFVYGSDKMIDRYTDMYPKISELLLKAGVPYDSQIMLAHHLHREQIPIERFTLMGSDPDYCCSIPCDKVGYYLHGRGRGEGQSEGQCPKDTCKRMAVRIDLETTPVCKFPPYEV